MPISRKKSCVRCRQSKLRCNQGIPSCSRCSERGALCVYGWNAADAIPYAHTDTPRVRRISSTSSRINGESPDHASRPENPNNISALSASTLIDPQFQTTNFSLDGFELDFTLTNPHAERPFGTSKSGHVPGESTESATFPTCTNVQEFLEIEALGSHAETLDMMTSHGNESGTWSLERTIFPSPTPHAPQTTSVQLPARRGTFQRRNAIRHCLASSVVLGQLTSFPKMMIQGDRLPPFICSPCQMREELAFDCAKNRRHRCLPKDLAICAGLVEIFYSRTPQNADFVWKTIYAEANRLHREHESYDVYQHLAAFQAMTIYALLQALDVETSEANGAQSLLGNVIDISVSAGKRNKVVIDNLNEIPTRQQWVHEESVRRTMIILLIVDLLLEGLLEHQLIRYRSICNAGFDNIPLPASRDLWEAETNFSWRNEYEKYLSQRKANKVLTVADLTELTEGGALKTLLETDPKFDLVPDAFAWCEGLDSLGSLLWMVIPFQQRRTQPGMSEVW